MLFERVNTSEKCLLLVVMNKAFCLDLAQGRMNEALHET